MPEGHTVHRLARLHTRRYRDQRMRVTSPQGRFADGAQVLDGDTFRDADAWGKHLVQRWASGRLVHIHLGLYGRFSDVRVPMKPPVGAVRMRLIGTDHGGDLRGPTACELYTPEDLDALVARLGPDPLRGDADPDRAFGRLHRSRRPIGALLMDQKVIAGVGNVYRAEVLFRHNIHPQRAGTDVAEPVWDAVWSDIVALMEVGVRRGRIVTIRPQDDHGAPGIRGRPRSYVYRRGGQPCRLCGTTILATVLEGRNLCWCPHCQPD